jgi:spermidine/putrescine transport system substrate-binding protein
MIIPKVSDRQDAAMAWINYCYDPAHSAQIVAAAPYLSDVKGAGEALAKIKPDLAKSELINPPDTLRARLHVFRGLDDAEDKAFNQIFQDAIGA